MMSKVFVYGTLKRGFRNHHVMHGNAQFLGVGRTLQKWPLVRYGERNVPYLLPLQGLGKHIRGEVWTCSEEKLREMDVFEGVPTYYDRLLIDVVMEEEQEASNALSLSSLCSSSSLDVIGRTQVFAYVKKEHSADYLNTDFLECFTPEHNLQYRRRSEVNPHPALNLSSVSSPTVSLM
ncbi:GGACT domain-containing protein [Balamuthia mandrillaris]